LLEPAESCAKSRGEDHERGHSSSSHSVTAITPHNDRTTAELGRAVDWGAYPVMLT
jgi:hypothetical protein